MKTRSQAQSIPRYARDIVRRYDPSHSFAAQLASEGVAAFPILHLASSYKAANLFRSAVEASRSSHGPLGACLHLYAAQEYEQMQMFIDEDALAGFALKGQEVVSVFSHKARKLRRASRTLMALAAVLGGVMLNCYDTALPGLYAHCGFQSVARLPWDDRFAPRDWDFDATRQFNDGRPDVVFMAFSVKHTELQTVGSYDEGLKVQRLAIGTLFEEVSA